MGAEEVKSDAPRRFTDIFTEVFPHYLMMGMTYELFWEGDPTLATSYRKAYRLRQQQTNYEMWLNGVYTMKALGATVGNMLGGKGKIKYPTEPLPITEEDLREKREREQRLRMEKLKATFTARALSVNARLNGGVTNDD